MYPLCVPPSGQQFPLVQFSKKFLGLKEENQKNVADPFFRKKYLIQKCWLGLMDISNTQDSSSKVEQEPQMGFLRFNFITFLSSAGLPWIKAKSQATSDSSKESFQY